jgi:hypothetical protein
VRPGQLGSFVHWSWSNHERPQPTCFDKLSMNEFSLANETFKRPWKKTLRR